MEVGRADEAEEEDTEEETEEEEAKEEEEKGVEGGEENEGEEEEDAEAEVKWEEDEEEGAVIEVSSGTLPSTAVGGFCLLTAKGSVRKSSFVSSLSPLAPLIRHSSFAAIPSQTNVPPDCSRYLTQILVPTSLTTIARTTQGVAALPPPDLVRNQTPFSSDPFRVVGWTCCGSVGEGKATERCGESEEDRCAGVFPVEETSGLVGRG